MRRVIELDKACEAEFIEKLCLSIRLKSKQSGIRLDDNVVAMPTRLSTGEKEYRVVGLRGKRGFVVAAASLVCGLAVTLVELPLKLCKRAGSDVVSSLLVKTGRIAPAEHGERNIAGHILIVDHEVGIVESAGAVGSAGSGYFSVYESWEREENKECRRLYLARDFMRLGIERVNRLPESYKELWSIYRDAWRKFYQVARLVLSKKDLRRDERLILAKAAIYYLGFRYLESRIIERRVRDLCTAEQKIRFIVTTIEGHPYERMISRWARRAGKVHVGYVNTPFVKYQHAVLRSEGESMPNVLIMESAIDHKRMNSRLATLANRGSEDIQVVRRNGCYPPLEEVRELMLRRVNGSGRMKILVVPSGTMKEVRSLLHKAIECVSMIPELEMSVRFHPFIKRKAERLANEMVNRVGVARQVAISKPMSLEECIDESDCVLYISSSAAVKGLFRGAIPINCGTGYERDLDPLYFSQREIEESRSVVDAIKEIMQIKTTRNEKMMMEILERYTGLWGGVKPLDNEELAKICGLSQQSSEV